MTMAKPPASPYSGANASAPVDGVKRGCSEKRVIVIDPGHGGTENKPGSSANNATSVSGPKEKTLTLDFALSLRLQLASSEVKAIFESRGYCDVGVILTRETDINLTGSQRVAVATVNKADILISIHFNGGGASARGTETFYKSASNPQQSNEAEDKALAQTVNDGLYAAIRALDPGAKNRGAKPDTDTQLKSLGILRDAGIGLSGKMCRSILIEVEFISNVAADALLVSGSNAKANRDAAMLGVAKALARAL